MNIVIATQKAHKLGVGIYRKSWLPNNQYVLLPTNTRSGFVGIPISSDGKPFQRWEPSLREIIADDWMVKGEV